MVEALAGWISGKYGIIISWFIIGDIWNICWGIQDTRDDVNTNSQIFRLKMMIMIGVDVDVPDVDDDDVVDDDV